MTESIIYGILEFSSPLLCSADALGQSVEVAIDGCNGSFTLPSLPEWKEEEKDPLRKLLLGPNPVRTWKRDDELIFWGSPIAYPSGSSKVERALIEFPLDSDNFDSCAQQIYAGFGKWLNLFQQYITLLTTQNTRCRIVSNEGQGNIELYVNEPSKLRRISRNKPSLFTVYISDINENIHFEQFKEAARLSSLRLSPKLEYIMLLEAYSARRSRDFRKSIIEAANSLEICLTGRIMDEFSRQGISFGEKLLQKFRMLGGRFELIKLLGIALPDKDYESLVNMPRNKVVHRGFFPDQVLASQVITEVEELLRLFSPQIYQDTPEV